MMFLEEIVELLRIDITLEGVDKLGISCFVNSTIDSMGMAEFNMALSGIEM